MCLPLFPVYKFLALKQTANKRDENPGVTRHRSGQLQPGAPSAALVGMAKVVAAMVVLAMTSVRDEGVA